MDMPRLLGLLKWLAINLGLMAGAVLLALVAHAIVMSIVRRLARRTGATSGEIAITRWASPTRWMTIVACLWLALDLTTFPPGLQAMLRHLVAVAFIIVIAWLLIRGLHVGRDLFLSRYQISVADNLHARSMHTQIRVLERILITLIVVIAFGCILMTFDGVRQLGASLLASAGILGIILGVAAQKVLGTILAGFQLAITQPIRIDDVLIVEGEWGIIEEITLTYVVIRIWDLRRLIVPMTYFMEKPFQNWTRTSASLLGTVLLYVDGTVSVEPVRQELHRILKESPQWDGAVWGLQVTNVSERAVELRALMSAADASAAWDLRCKVREALLGFIKDGQPQALPRLRVETTAVPGPAPAGPSATPDNSPGEPPADPGAKPADG